MSETSLGFWEFFAPTSWIVCEDSLLSRSVIFHIFFFQSDSLDVATKDLKLLLIAPCGVLQHPEASAKVHGIKRLLLREHFNPSHLQLFVLTSRAWDYPVEAWPSMAPINVIDQLTEGGGRDPEQVNLDVVHRRLTINSSTGLEDMDSPFLESSDQVSELQASPFHNH